MADVFISYARADSKAVESIAVAIENAGHSVWWDRLIDGGSEYSTDIEQQLNDAKVAIVVWSQHSRGSRWVRDEAAAAADSKKLIPISLDGDQAPMGFRQFQLVQFSRWSGNEDSTEIAELLRVITGRLDGSTENARPTPLKQAVEKTKIPPIYALAAGIALLAIALAALLFRQPSDGHKSNLQDIAGAQTTEKSVAVLPFSTFNVDDDNQFLALALHDEVLTQLAKIADMRVISRTSVMSYENSRKTLPQIATELGVAMIMEGSVNLIGERVRINVKLFNANNEELVWENTDETNFTANNLFEIQADITRNIARELGSVLTGAERTALSNKPTQNTAAYDAYLRGKWSGRYGDVTEAEIIQAIGLFDEAIRLDPLFVDAYAEKAVAHLSLYWSGRERPDNLAAARAALDRASAIDPDNARTLAARGTFLYRVFFDYEQSITSLERALTFVPGDPDALDVLASVYRRSGQFDPAVTYFERNFTLNPMIPTAAANYAYTLGLVGAFDKAKEVTSRGLRANPSAPYLLGAAATVHIWDNDIETAWSTAQKFPFIDSGAYDYFRSQMALYLRDEDRLEALIEKWPAPRDSAPYLDYFDVMHALALHQLGQSAASQALLDDLQPRVEAKLEEEPLHTESRKIIAAIYGLRGDKQELQRVHEGLVKNPPKDRLWLLEEGFIVIIAHLLVDENDKALAHIEELMELANPSQFARAELSPFFDSVRETPRYQDLKNRYDAWIAENR